MRVARSASVATLSVAAALSVLGAAPALAHHSFAMFDMTKNVSVEGTVKDFQWTNPHVWIDMLVQDPTNGQAVEWSIEGSSPNILERGGWKRDSIKIGDKISVVVHPLKKGDNGGSLVSAAVNGQTIGGIFSHP